MPSIDTDQAFDKIQHSFMIKIFNELWMQENFLNLIKQQSNKQQKVFPANIYLMVNKQKSITFLYTSNEPLEFEIKNTTI